MPVRVTLTILGGPWAERNSPLISLLNASSSDEVRIARCGYPIVVGSSRWYHAITASSTSTRPMGVSAT
jgi:hypothetical protein